MSKILDGNRIFAGTVPEAALHPDVLAKIAGGMTSEQVDAKIDAMKMLLFGGEVDAALNSFKELAEAITADRSGLAAMQQVLLGKASPADITTAVNAMRDMLLGGASDSGNTLRKLETMVVAAQQAAINAIADNVVTNAKLAADVKVGSLNAAANAFPVGVQSGLTSVEKFLVYLSQQLSAVQANAGQQQSTGSNHEARLTAVEQALPGKASANDVNGLSQRVAAAENSLVGKASATELSGIAIRVGAAENNINNLTTRVAAVEARPTGGSQTGTSLTDNSVTNAHLTQDIKAGSISDANSALSTTAVSVTGLIVQIYNRLTQQIQQVAAGSGVAIEQNLTSNATTSVPSVRATKEAITAAIASSVGNRFAFGQRGNVAAGTISLLEAGTFTANEVQNIASHTVKKNGNVVSYPFTFAQGDNYEITIVRTTEFTTASLIWKP